MSTAYIFFFFFLNPVYPHIASVKLGSAAVWRSEAQGDGGATLPAPPAALPGARGANTSPREREGQADSHWLAVTVRLPCSRLEEQNVKSQDKFKCQASHEACQSGLSILCGAQISHCRTRRQRSWLPFDVHAEHRSSASPRDHSVHSLSWDIRDLRLLPNSSVNSCTAAPGWVLAGFQVTATWIEEQSEILAACTLPWAEQQHLQGGTERCLWCHGPAAEPQQKWSAHVGGLSGRHFGPAASKPVCLNLCGEWRRLFRCFEARRVSKSGHQWLKGWL